MSKTPWEYFRAGFFSAYEGFNGEVTGNPDVQPIEDCWWPKENEQKLREAFDFFEKQNRAKTRYDN